MEERVLEHARLRGYGFVTPAMNRMFAHMKHRAIGISELARQLAITRQSVYQTAVSAHRRGLIEFIDHPEDRRVKLIRFNKNGIRMSVIASRALDQIEQELAAHLGQNDLETLCRILEKAWSGEEAGARERDVA